MLTDTGSKSVCHFRRQREVKVLTTDGMILKCCGYCRAEHG